MLLGISWLVCLFLLLLPGGFLRATLQTSTLTKEQFIYRFGTTVFIYWIPAWLLFWGLLEKTLPFYREPIVSYLRIPLSFICLLLLSAMSFWRLFRIKQTTLTLKEYLQACFPLLLGLLIPLTHLFTFDLILQLLTRGLSPLHLLPLILLPISIFFFQLEIILFFINCPKTTLLQQEIIEVFKNTGLTVPNARLSQLPEINLWLFAGYLAKPVLLFTKIGVDTFTNEEIKAVLLHEAGHVKNGHMRRQFLRGGLIAFSGWGLLSLLHPHLPTAPLTSFATVLFLSLFLFMVLGLVERLLGHLPLDQELEADAFVVDSGAGKDLLTALGKIFACSTFTAETIIHLPPQSQQRVKILLEQQGDTSQKNP